MALTYDQHKAAIDAAYPTPPIEWARQDDHITFRPQDVAAAELRFNGEDYHYLGTHWQSSIGEEWQVRRVLDGGTIEFAINVEVSWDDAKSAFETYWEDHCEGQRAILAASAYGKDVVDDRPGDVPVVRLSFLHIGGTGQPTIPLNPGLSDERFEYAATTSLETVTMTATVPIGASVRWLFEHVITVGQTRTVDLLPGASHLVNITVTQSGHRSSNYALVITRT